MSYTIPGDVDVSPEIIKYLESICANPAQVQEQLNNVVDWAYDMAYGAYGKDASNPGDQ